MGYLIGAGLAVVVGAFGSLVRLDRDRAFYSTILIVVAAYYVLFAAMGQAALLGELAIAAIFVLMAAVGFRGSLWIVVIGLAAHGVMDVFHGHLISNPGVPVWWPQFCSAYDVVAAGYLALLIRRRVVPTHAMTGA